MNNYIDIFKNKNEYKWQNTAKIQNVVELKLKWKQKVKKKLIQNINKNYNSISVILK